MSFEESFVALRKIQQRIEVLEQTTPSTRSGSEGGDGGGGMDQRLGRLEVHVDGLGDKLDRRTEQLSDRLGKVETELATLAERVRHLPSKDFIVTRLLAMLALIAALVTFSDKLRQLVS